MMDKNFVQLKEEELKDVVGGDNFSTVKLISMDTSKEAANFLVKCGMGPSTAEFKFWMKKWEDAHF